MSQSESKLRNSRPAANSPSSGANSVNLLDRLAILASVLITLQQSVANDAAAESRPAQDQEEQGPDGEFQVAADTQGSGLPVERVVLPSSSGQAPGDGAEGAGTPGLAQAPGPGADLGGQPPEEEAGKPVVRLGSSTPPNLLNQELVADQASSAALALEKIITATSSSDVIVSSIPSTTFVFTGAAGPGNFDVFVGTGRGNTVDFSGLTDLVPPVKDESGEQDAELNRDLSAPNGVFVDLTAKGQTVDTPAGPVTVQAWQLDENGKAETPLAHLQNIDNVTGTAGNDVVIGNAYANTFTYTATDGASGGGQGASYGFDIYYGGHPESGEADGGDAADFSRLGSQESVAAGEGDDKTELPNGATGITVDLSQPVTISAVDPATGEECTVTGSVVSTIGGSEQVDLALLAWTETDEAGEGQSTIEDIIGSGGSDVVAGNDAANTYVVTGDGENGVSVFDGRGGNDTIDFSEVAPSTAEASESAPAVVPDGVYVNLGSTGHTAPSSAGTVTVQAWAIGPDGTASTPLAHIENVETVAGTVGSDILVGDDNANTFVYTADDDAVVTSSGEIEVGPEASYGFDIYSGGGNASTCTTDTGDRADFSVLGSQESVAAAMAEGTDAVLLPNGATGITVDLAEAVTVTTVDPESGEIETVTGSMVSTIGGTEDTDLALLEWTAPEDGSEGQSTIEEIVTTGGRDAIWGDDADNTVVVSGCGGEGPAFFDGRGGNDTVDFSALGLPDPDDGIEIHLNQKSDGVTDPTGGTQSGVVQATIRSDDRCDLDDDDRRGSNGDRCDDDDRRRYDDDRRDDDDRTVAQVKDVENVVGTRGNDIIEGDENDNILTGGGGSDMFVFADVAVVDGRNIPRIGHDIIRDFRRGGIDDDDYLVFDSSIFNFHDGSSLDWIQQLLTDNRIRDDDEGLIILIDEDNSIRLQNYDLDDHSGHGPGLSAYASWIVFV